MGLFDWLSKSGAESDTFALPSGLDERVGLVASPDSTRLAYAVSTGNRAHVEVSGKRLARYDAVSGITFSPDSRRVAYAAMRRDCWFVVCDEQEYGPYDDVGKTSPVFSPDSTRFAHTARRGNEWYVGINGRDVAGPYEGFSPGGIVFSPDSNHILYVIKKGASWAAATEVKEEQAYPTILQRSWTFSPDSKTTAYVAGVKGSQFGNAWAGEAAVVINAAVQHPWPHDERTKRDGLSNEVYFSPDSRRTAYGVTRGGRFSFIGDGSPQIQSDGVVSGWGGNPLWTKFPDYGKTICRDESFVFSPDSRHFAYAISDRDRHLFIYDGDVKGNHSGILNAPPVFSPDSRRVAYGAEDGQKQLLILDWKPQGLYDGLPAVAKRFSDDSARIAYVASKGASFLLVVDSQSWTLTDGPVIGSRIVWDDSRRLHLLVAMGQKITVQRFEA